MCATDKVPGTDVGRLLAMSLDFATDPLRLPATPMLYQFVLTVDIGSLVESPVPSEHVARTSDHAESSPVSILYRLCSSGQHLVSRATVLGFTPAPPACHEAGQTTCAMTLAAKPSQRLGPGNVNHLSLATGHCHLLLFFGNSLYTTHILTEATACLPR